MKKRRTASGWIDISVGLRDGMAHWPSNPPVKIERALDMDRGDHCNVSILSMGSHTGTHVDAPIHFLKGGKGIDQMPFSATNGPARVIEVRSRGAISAQELLRHKIRRGERILLKTSNSARCWQARRFVTKFAYLSTEAGLFLASRGVRMIGVDCLSVGGYHKNGTGIHHALLEAGIWIIEGLDLSLARSGRFELSCLPIKIIDGDGAPARAVLRKIRQQ